MRHQATSTVLCLLGALGCVAPAGESGFEISSIAADQATFDAADEASVDANLAQAEASNEGCLARGDDDVDPVDARRLQALLDTARSAFPELEGFNIRLRWTTSDTDFVRTGFSPWSPFRSAANREYRVVVSRNFLDRPPPDQALVAIFTHELFHIVDYTNMNGLELIGLGIRYVASPRSFVPRYETHTDRRTVERGQSCGLRDFRRWQQRTLRQEDFVVKQRNYLDLVELEALCPDN